MNNIINLFDEQEVKSLIKKLIIEKERYVQEKLAQKIGSMKDERTAELVSELFYSEDAYIRNMGIELFIALEEKSLPVLKRKLTDGDRNIRKFALDALKYIKGNESCEIALIALEDVDENVVEAALEVIALQSYSKATGKLLDLLKNTSSVWIINALLRTFASLEGKNVSRVIEEKIFSVEATTIEKNILVNTYVRTLGSIGTYDDIEVIINKYSKDYMIDDGNLFFGLSNLVVKNDILKPKREVVQELEKIFKEHWDYKDSSQIFSSIEAFVKLQLDFFLQDIKEIYNFYKGEEFFIENLYDLIQKLNDIPVSFVNEMLSSEEPELIIMGIRLIYTKKLPGFNSIVEELCSFEDKEVSKMAISIITELDSYKNNLLLERLMDFSEEIEIASVEGKLEGEAVDIEYLLFKLDNQSRKVRKAVAKMLAQIPGKVDIESLEEIVMGKNGEDGMEALEVLYRVNAEVGMRHITSRMDSTYENVRTGLIEIMEYSPDIEFYSFMNTMINDSSPKVRKKTIKALNSKIDDRSFCLLEKLYGDESDIVNKMAIVLNLHRFKNDNALDIVINATSSKDILTRIAAVRSLGFFNNSRGDFALQGMLSDEVEEVREAAVEALCRTEVVE
ncbi:MAG TPA: HEAT repeat domain-containing protein [Ruminiclostridium sp.]